MFSDRPQCEHKEDSAQHEKKYLYELWIHPAEYQQWQKDIDHAYNFGLWFENDINQKIIELTKELDSLKHSLDLRKLLDNVKEKIKITMQRLSTSKQKLAARLESSYCNHALLMTQLSLLRESLINNLQISIHFEYLNLLEKNNHRLLKITCLEFNRIVADIAAIEKNGHLICLPIDAKQVELKNIAELFNIILNRLNPANKPWAEYYNPWTPPSKLSLIAFITEGIDAFNLEYKKQKKFTEENKNEHKEIDNKCKNSKNSPGDPLQYHAFRLKIAPHVYDFEKNILQDCKDIRSEARKRLSQAAFALWKKLDTIYHEYWAILKKIERNIACMKKTAGNKNIIPLNFRDQSKKYLSQIPLVLWKKTDTVDHEYWAILKKIENNITRTKKAAESKNTTCLPQVQPYPKWSPALFTIPENREKHLLMLHTLSLRSL